MERIPTAVILNTRTKLWARSTNSRGFTLIEMLVVLAIIIVVTAIALSGQTGFNRTLSLNNAAYDIALSIRDAQSLGLSSQAVNGVGNAPYGIAFQTVPNTSYVLFADTYPPTTVNCGSQPMPSCKPGNGEYDSSASPSELLQTYNLNNGFTLSKFCVTENNGTNICSTTGGLTNLDVSFARPNADTLIMGKVSGWLQYKSACVTVNSPQGDSRYVKISENSQVSIGTSCP